MTSPSDNFSCTPGSCFYVHNPWTVHCYMAIYGRTISSQLSLLCAHKTSLKKSDYVIHRKCILSNKSKIEEMEDQVLIPGENAHYLLLILIIHIGGLFPFPDTQQVKHAGQGRYWCEIWCGLSDISLPSQWSNWHFPADHFCSFWVKVIL